MIDRRTFIAGSGAMLASTATLARPVPVTVETRHGRLMGERVDGICAFKDVPYGWAPLARRFMPSLPVVPWPGLRSAIDYGPKAPQPLGRGDPPFLASWNNPQSEQEDCLRLNLWTPDLTGAGRPVMVWLHGGGFSSGSGSSLGFDGHNLARNNDVILVSVTHRLNAFGHLYLGRMGGSELADSGNVGMLDIVTALEWTRDNIERFGGDPANVTLFGQSGGAGKVTVLMAMPSAKGLFHRAIVQSGSTGIGARTATTASEDAEALLSVMGLTPRNLDKLRTAPIASIKQGMKALSDLVVDGKRPWGGFTKREWRPVMDGRAIREHPFYPRAPETSAMVPLMIGTTHDECRYHLGLALPNAFDLLSQDLKPALDNCTGRDMRDDISFFASLYPSSTPSELMFQIFTSWRWRHSAIWQAERKVEQARAPVYMYRMDWRTPIEGGKWRAMHEVDVPFAFDNLQRSPSFVGDPARPQPLATTMSRAFAAFARTGDPNHAGLPRWLTYTEEARETLLFDTVSAIASDPESAEREFYNGQPPRLPL